MDKQVVSYERFAFASELFTFMQNIKLTLCMNKPLLVGALVYGIGLIVLKNPTANSISERVCQGVSHDTLERALSTIRFDITQVITFFIQFLQEQTLGSTGWLVIDDVVVKRPFSRHTSIVSYVYDHTSKKKLLGIQVVVLLWCNGFIKIPIGYKVYIPKKVAESFDKKFKTKIQLAIELMDSPALKLLPVSFVTFDSWYSSKDLLKYLIKHQYHFVAMIKSNRLFKVEGKRTCIPAKDICKSFNKTQFRYYRNYGFYMRGLDATLTDVGNVKLAIVKNGYNASLKSTRFIVTDMMALPVAAILDNYLRRWHIEVFFRDIKQLLSFEKFFQRQEGRINGHFTMVFICYLFLEYVKITKKLSTIGEACKYLYGISRITIKDTPYSVYITQDKHYLMQGTPTFQDQKLIATIIMANASS